MSSTVHLAADRARELVAAGRPYGVACHIAAKEYGTTTQAVAAALGKRGTRKQKNGAAKYRKGYGGMTDAEYEIDIQNRLLWWLWTGEWRDK
jgi:hypothetical protein